ncbi:MAG TPA: HD domain-containing phosphohydrolase [Terracidiphilus sp.]|nr:HD domain-containing phosphohydrolase [Terracidiphilus sp.]
MQLRTKVLVCAVVAGAAASLYSAKGHPERQWLHFIVYLIAILLSSGMKVAMPKSDGTASVNFPFILLGIVQLSPLQTVALAAASVIAQCRFKVVKAFTLIQIVFNVANVVTATVLACHSYASSLPSVGGEVAPALAIAVTVYFLANSIPLALVLGWESGKPVLRQWHQEFPWLFPFYLVGAMLAAAANYVGDHFGWLTSMLLIPMVYTVYRAYSTQTAIIRDREQHVIEIEALQLRTIEGLAMAIEAKDQNTHRHLMRVRVYVSELGKIVGLDDARMKALITAAYLHDIGKLAVPESILNKPGKLNPAEFDKLKIHPVVGAEILERVRFPYPVVPIVRSHHEAWDGSGYPDGLKGEEIPIGARILTAVDCFDALASERPYRNAMPLPEAMALVKSKSGTQLDPEIVRLLDENYLRLEEKARHTIEEMAALDTAMFIERGAAPAAGFAQEDGKAEHEAGNGAEAPVSLSLQSGQQLAGADQRAVAVIALREMLTAAGNTHLSSAVVSDLLQSLIPFDGMAVYFRSGDWVIAEYIDSRSKQAFSTQPIPFGKGLSGWVAENGRPIVNGNPTVEPNFLTESALFTAASSALSLPFRGPEGEITGVLTFYARDSAAFSKDHLRLVEEIGPQQIAFALVDRGKSETVAQAAGKGSPLEFRGARS